MKIVGLLLLILGAALVASEDVNVNGEPLEACSTDPMTGWEQDGYCRSGGTQPCGHTVCALLTQRFLDFIEEKPDDSLHSPDGNLPDLQEGDKWCVCAEQWDSARKRARGPPLIVNATNLDATDVIGIGTIQKYGALVG